MYGRLISVSWPRVHSENGTLAFVPVETPRNGGSDRVPPPLPGASLTAFRGGWRARGVIRRKIVGVARTGGTSSSRKKPHLMGLKMPKCFITPLACRQLVTSAVYGTAKVRYLLHR